MYIQCPKCEGAECRDVQFHEMWLQVRELKARVDKIACYVETGFTPLFDRLTSGPLSDAK